MWSLKTIGLVTGVAVIGMVAWASVERRHIAVAETRATATSTSASADPTRTERDTLDSLERAFVAGGRIRMELSAGQYRIDGAPDNRIEIRWSVRDTDRLSDVRVKADVKGNDATITAEGPSQRFRVTIRVPSRTDLYLRLSAGEIALRGVEGHKDIKLNAGELDIDVGRAEDYSQVDASLWAGEIQAAPFRTSREGLFRSFNWRGPGKYRLDVHTMAGEIRLHTASAASPAPVER